VTEKHLESCLAGLADHWVAARDVCYRNRFDIRIVEDSDNIERAALGIEFAILVVVQWIDGRRRELTRNKRVSRLDLDVTFVFCRLSS
jgi:hypothetical protein